MATKKKGCGFLITSLIILLLGAGIAAFLGMNVVSDSKKLATNINDGETFVSPESLTYSPEQDGDASIWIITDLEEPDTSMIQIQVTETGSNTTIPVTETETKITILDQLQMASFPAESGKDYLITVNGAKSGEKFKVSNTLPSDELISTVGKGFGAIGIFLGAAFLAFIFGIIGLIKFFSSKSSAQAPPAA